MDDDLAMALLRRCQWLVLAMEASSQGSHFQPGLKDRKILPGLEDVVDAVAAPMVRAGCARCASTRGWNLGASGYWWACCAPGTASRAAPWHR
jgi:hypothetical protein